MSDIVERLPAKLLAGKLREIAAMQEVGMTGGWQWLKDSADEIERLRRQRDELLEALDWLVEECSALQEHTSTPAGLDAAAEAARTIIAKAKGTT